jgi:hypothetical protein
MSSEVSGAPRERGNVVSGSGGEQTGLGSAFVNNAGGFAVLHLTKDIEEDELAAGRFTVEVTRGANEWEIHA